MRQQYICIQSTTLSCHQLNSDKFHLHNCNPLCLRLRLTLPTGFKARVRLPSPKAMQSSYLAQGYCCVAVSPESEPMMYDST